MVTHLNELLDGAHHIRFFIEAGNEKRDVQGVGERVVAWRDRGGSVPLDSRHAVSSSAPFDGEQPLQGADYSGETAAFACQPVAGGTRDRKTALVHDRKSLFEAFSRDVPSHYHRVSFPACPGRTRSSSKMRKDTDLYTAPKPMRNSSVGNQKKIEMVQKLALRLMSAAAARTKHRRRARSPHARRGRRKAPGQAQQRRRPLQCTARSRQCRCQMSAHIVSSIVSRSSSSRATR